MESTNRPLQSQFFRPGNLRFEYDCNAGYFRHNYDRDLHMFVLWERAKPEWDTILRSISQRFSLIQVFSNRWSKEHVSNNFLRLYGSAPNNALSEALTKERRDAVGEGEFLLIVVEDSKPVYGFEQTFSGKVEMVNRNITAAKAEYRKIAGGGIRIHSSNSIAEFFRDCTLLLGIDLLQGVLESEPSSDRTTLAQDLAGTDGWGSVAQLLAHLLPSTNYLVLRNFEDLPNIKLSPDTDLDVLVHDAEDFAAIANAQVSVERFGKFSCNAKIGDKYLRLDVRFVGDGYYDTRWQDAMLRGNLLHMNIAPIPSAEDHFFSLLYHVKLHKPAVSTHYADRLSRLAREIGLDNFDPESAGDNARSAKLLAGYLCYRHYDRTTPKDPFLSVNLPFSRLLSKQGVLWEREARQDESLVASIVCRMPLIWRLKGKPLTFLTKAHRYVRTRFFAG